MENTEFARLLEEVGNVRLASLDVGEAYVAPQPYSQWLLAEDGSGKSYRYRKVYHVGLSSSAALEWARRAGVEAKAGGRLELYPHQWEELKTVLRASGCQIIFGVHYPGSPG